METMPEFHVYYCGGCNFHFAVGTDLEEQHNVVCPECRKDDSLEEAGYGVIEILVAPDDQAA